MIILLDVLVLCMDFSSQQSHGVAGSPMKTLEAFSLSTKEVKLISRTISDNPSSCLAYIIYRAN